MGLRACSPEHLRSARIRVRKTSTNPDFRGVNPSSEPRAVLHRSGRASFLPRNADFRIGRASFLPRNADFRIGRAVFLPRAELLRIGRAVFLPRAELLRPVGAILSRHRLHRHILEFLYSSCVPPVASDQRSSGFLVYYTFIYIYARARGLLNRKDYRQITSFTCHTSTPDIATKRYAGGITCPCCALPPVI